MISTKDVNVFDIYCYKYCVFFLYPPPSPKLPLLCLHSLCLLLNPPPQVWEHSDHSDHGVTMGQGEGEHGEVSLRGRRQGLSSELRKAAGSAHSLDLEKENTFVKYGLKGIRVLYLVFIPPPQVRLHEPHSLQGVSSATGIKFQQGMYKSSF